MASLQHTHTYAIYKKRSGTSVKEKVFRCADPSCTHFAEYELVVGKMSCCNLCGKEYILDREAARASFPRCLECSNSKRAQVKRAAASLLGQLIPSDEERLDGDEIGD